MNIFSSKSIQNAIKDIQKQEQEIIRKTKLLAQRLAEEGVQVATVQISAMGAVDTGELVDSINLKEGTVLTNGSRWIVYTNCPYAPFVEFGTGIVGQGSPHPNPQPVVGQNGVTYSSYDQNNHGDDGWFYIGDDGKRHWTKGMPSRPFMYNTTYDLYYKVYAIANEVFGV